MTGHRLLPPEEGLRLEPFRPRGITVREARLRRVLYRNRRAFETRIGEGRLRLRPVARTSLREGHGFDLEIGGIPARIVMDRALHHRLLEHARTDLPFLGLAPAIEGMVLERLFEHALPGVERHLGTVRTGTAPASAEREPIEHAPIGLEPIGRPSDDHAAGGHRVRRDFMVRINDEQTWFLALFAPPELIERIDGIWRRQPVIRRRMTGLPMTMALRTMRTSLGHAAIFDLAPGDIVFADAAPAEQGCFLGVIENALAVPLRVDGNRLRAQSPALAFPQIPSPWQPMIEDLMSDDMDRDDDLAWGDVPVDLVFELLRLRMPLKQLQSLEAGYVLELDRPLSEAVDIRVHGKRIGRGELVVVQDRLGVRIVTLNGPAVDGSPDDDRESGLRS
ncbi:MAG: type III secretion system cytoplasmic ring protein SctQ [Geminicoccaceae bacterium]